MDGAKFVGTCLAIILSIVGAILVMLGIAFIVLWISCM